MGSCISKCSRKKKLKEEDSSRHVHDKLVISQDAPIISPAAKDITKMPINKPLSPAPSTSSAASFSSFSCSTTMASSISSSSSLSSSSSTSYSSTALKDRSFSNDFLWSCAKENPHVVGLNKIPSQNLDPPVVVSSPLVTRTKQTVREKVTVNAAATTPKKRSRANSPTLVRQKSFRKEQNFASSTPNRGLRSPSPSRRFNGESNRIFPVKENYYRKPAVSKGNAVSSAPRRESFRAPISPSREPAISRDYAVRKSEAFSQHICSKIDGRVAVKDGNEMDIVMEDINNPLIALDCFIFL